MLTGVLAVAPMLRRFERDIGMDDRGPGVPVTDEERRARQLGIGLTAGGASTTGPM